MSRTDCISNRNIKIIAAYVRRKTGSHENLFEDLPYPCDAFESAEKFFLDEDEWTTYDNFEKIFRRAKEQVGESDFYFACGSSSASLRSWGRFHVFSKLFISPRDGFKRIPFFNKNLNDTKEIDIVFPPAFDSRLRKFRTILKVEFHRDVDPNSDYIGDPFLCGVISAIPTLWGLEPASIRQPMKQYDPEILFSKEAEFKAYQLQPKKEGDLFTIRHPGHGGRSIVGEKVYLLPEQVGDRKLFLGRFTKNKDDTATVNHQREAMLITETVMANGRTLLREGDLYMAPYFILDVTFDRISLFERLASAFFKGEKENKPDAELISTLNQLRESIRSKNEAFAALEKAHGKLQEAKKQIDGYAADLELKVEERTAELDRARVELLEMNRNLESKVQFQLAQLERTNRLRRYLSPKITEMILAEEGEGEEKSKRKMMTVVFSDIRGFSKMTDGLEPEEIFHLLDRYLSEMIETVHRFDGTLNKILGDGLLVFFNDPISVEDHAQRAVSMALEMQKKVLDLRREWREYGHELAIGIGINTGFMNVGNIGPMNHRDYTVIGNQVNVAARLESLAGPGQILVSQRTMSRVNELVESEYVDEVPVKGIHSPVKIYNIKGLKGEESTTAH